jgi:hypothetical protein
VINLAHLKKESPWYELFENGAAPIRNILVPRAGDMEGFGVCQFYDLDVPRLTETQRRRIAEAVAKQCGGSPAEVEAHMLREGFIPLRALHVEWVSSNSLAFL